MSLIVTGTLGIDSVETPTGSAERVPGGSAAYFCAAASAQGPVRLVGVVGGDWPEEHHAALRGFEGIDLSGLERREDSSTFAWGGRYLENMNERETLFTELGVLEEKVVSHGAGSPAAGAPCPASMPPQACVRPAARAAAVRNASTSSESWQPKIVATSAEVAEPNSTRLRRGP